jgi:MFS family permease
MVSRDAPNSTSPSDEDLAGARDALGEPALQPLARRPNRLRSALVAVTGLALSVLLVAQAGGDESLGEVLAARRSRLLAFIAITNLYILSKGAALLVAARSCDVQTSLVRSLRTFCESSLIGLVVAKIASDVYKYARIGAGERGPRVRAILVYRIAAILAVLLLSGVVSVMWAERAPYGLWVWVVPVLVIGGLIGFYRSRATDWIRQHGAYVGRVLPFSLAALAAKIAGLSVLLGITLDGGVVEVAAAFLVIGSLASMTQVPAGLGTLDAGYAIFLTKYLGAGGAETAAFLVSLRLLGPVYVGLLGGLSLCASAIFGGERVSRSLPRAHDAAG